MMLSLIAMAFALGDNAFSAANDALAAGDLAGAEAGYRQALDAGAIDADVYYNLGNVLFRQEDIPLAVLAWRRALVLAPRDPDPAANLDFARRRVRDESTAPDPWPAWAPWQAALTPGEGQLAGGAVLGVGLIALGLRRRWPDLPMAGVGGVAALVGCGIGLGGVAEATLPPAAVVLVAEVTAHSDLGGGVDLFALHGGAEIRVIEVASGQVLVALADGRRGWLPREAVGSVDPDAAMPLRRPETAGWRREGMAR
ncbi:MAG: tetratricopeptide repeat protein [Myxococcales bacterium]|nr:tetratricopeptide repeat protein [Myxococcales bacterium]